MYVAHIIYMNWWLIYIQSDFTALEKQCSHVFICMLCHMHVAAYIYSFGSFNRQECIACSDAMIPILVSVSAPF